MEVFVNSMVVRVVVTQLHNESNHRLYRNAVDQDIWCTQLDGCNLKQEHIFITCSYFHKHLLATVFHHPSSIDCVGAAGYAPAPNNSIVNI